MADLFSVSGPDLDQGYLNIQAGAAAVERELRAVLEKMWSDYEPFADPNFVAEFAREPDARFWEMYVTCQLLEAGKTLLPTVDRSRQGGQPDVCVLDGDRRIWIEAIAPDVGDEGPDQVRGPVPINQGGGLALAPTRQVQLRTTSALWTKTQKIKRYIRDGVIGADEVALVAVGAGRFGLYASEQPLPSVLSSVFAIGPEVVTVDLARDEIVDQRFEPSFRIERAGGAIPRTAFLDERFKAVSGVVWSRASIGNMRRAERPFTSSIIPSRPSRWQSTGACGIASSSPEPMATTGRRPMCWRPTALEPRRLSATRPSEAFRCADRSGNEEAVRRSAARGL